MSVFKQDGSSRQSCTQVPLTRLILYIVVLMDVDDSLPQIIASSSHSTSVTDQCCGVHVLTRTQAQYDYNEKQHIIATASCEELPYTVSLWMKKELSRRLHGSP